MKVFVTKYALTRGIREGDGEVGRGGYVYVKFPGDGLYATGCQCVLDRDAFTTADAAELAAKNMAAARVLSLRKQIEKLEKLAYAPKWSEP